MNETKRWMSDQDMTEVLHSDVALERQRQISKFGTQHHAPEWWMTILTEETGELAKAIMELNFSRDLDEVTTEVRLKDMRDELIQVAAVALSWLSDLDGYVVDDEDTLRKWPEVTVPDPVRWWELPTSPKTESGPAPATGVMELTESCSNGDHRGCYGCHCYCHDLPHVS